jgi:hypothetical protein
MQLRVSPKTLGRGNAGAAILANTSPRAFAIVEIEVLKRCSRCAASRRLARARPDYSE